MESSADFRAELEQVKKNVKAPNIAVIGKTGAGKSTLINKVFGQNFALTGAGFPVSKEFYRYPKFHEESVVVLYDSAGYEATKEPEFIKNVFNFFDALIKEGIEKQIHLVWYVVHGSSKRFEYFDAEIIKKLNKRGIPTITVLAQCDLLRPEEVHTIEKAIKTYEFEKNYELIKVAAEPIYGNHFGIDELIYQTIEKLPEIYTDAFVIAQVVSLKAKRKKAWSWVTAAAGTNFGVGYIPAPGTTPTAIIASHILLWNKISTLYGYTQQSGLLMAISTFGGATLTTFVGTLFLDTLGVFVPPSFALTSTSAGLIAAGYTTVVGLAYISACEKLATYIVTSNSGKKEIQNFLKETLKKEIKKYSNLNITSKDDIDRIGREFIEGNFNVSESN